MSTLTLRIPDDTHNRLRDLAKHRKISVNKMFEEMATSTLTEHDAEARFRARASVGIPKKGLKVLDKLDKKARS